MAKKLKLDWAGLSMDPKWFNLRTGEMVPDPEAEEVDPLLKIRPYPAELAKVLVRDDGLLIEGKTQKAIFFYCLRGWKNIDGADDQPLQFNQDVLKKVFDYKLGGIPDFVVLKSRQFQDLKKAQEKN